MAMKSTFQKFVVAAAGAALTFAVVEASPAQAASLVQNGSFESGPNPGSYLTLNAGSTAITGWTVTRAAIDYYGTGWVAADGNRSLDLNGTPGVGGIAQTFSTDPGQQYLVTFALAGHDSGLLQRMGVGAAGQSTEFLIPGEYRSCKSRMGKPVVGVYRS
jgi:choice-of-anchor C domain-containing protein